MPPVLDPPRSGGGHAVPPGDGPSRPTRSRWRALVGLAGVGVVAWAGSNLVHVATSDGPGAGTPHGPGSDAPTAPAGDGGAGASPGGAHDPSRFNH